MLTSDELAALESLLARARRATPSNHAAALDAIAPGDLVQLRPGACPTWETSILLVHKVDARLSKVRGAILRPHRSGCPEAWTPYSLAEIVRVGRMPFPEPAPDIRSWCYAPPCPLLLRKPPATQGAPAASPRQAAAICRSQRAALQRELREEAAQCRPRRGGTQQ